MTLQPDAPYKTCRKCGFIFPATLQFFYKNAGGKYGVTPRCKPCVDDDNAESHARRVRENPDRIKALANARMKKWYHANLEEARRKCREFARNRRQDPKEVKKIQSRKRGGGAGLTPEEIDTLFRSQGRVCAICGSDDLGSKIGWNLDHCHKTNKVRFVLCAHCNRGLGAFKDDPALMRNAADMLEKFYQHQADRPVSAILA